MSMVTYWPVSMLAFKNEMLWHIGWKKTLRNKLLWYQQAIGPTGQKSWKGPISTILFRK